MSDAFFREVDEDLRHKQLKNLWKKYGKFIIGVAVGIVVIVGGRAVYTNMVESKYLKEAKIYSAALKADVGEISSALDALLNSDVDGYQILATFKKAEIAINNDDNVAAAAIFDQFIANATVPQIYKDLASIQASLLMLDSETTDQTRSRLSLILNGDNGFQYLAEELIALSELKSGNIDEAKRRFNDLTENLEAPATVKDRIGQYLSIIE